MTPTWRARVLIGLFSYLFAFYYLAAIVVVIMLIDWLR